MERNHRNSFPIVVCRYENTDKLNNINKLKKVELSVDDLANTEYFAISHAWGDVQSLVIPGVTGEVN